MVRKKRKHINEKKVLLFLQVVGDTLHFLRLEQGQTFRQVAAAIHMSPRLIDRLEKGIHREFRYTTLERLCNHYGVTVNEFFSCVDGV